MKKEEGIDVKNELFNNGDLTSEKLTALIKNASEIIGEDDSIDDLVIVKSFHVGKFYWDRNINMKTKQIHFAFYPTPEEQKVWEERSFPKLSSLLSYLKNKYDGLDNFELIFFRKNKPKKFYFEKFKTKTNVLVNLDSYLTYANEINPEIKKLKVTKYSNKIMIEFSKKVPITFFNNKPPSSLIEELKQSNYKVIEEIIKEYENLPDDQKKDLKTIVEHSKLGDDTIKEFEKLKPNSPKTQLKLFVRVLDRLGKKELEILLRAILKSKSSRNFIQTIGELSPRDQNRIAHNLPEMSRMYERYEQLEESLKLFKEKIRKHLESLKKDEKDIHKFLTKHYWLLGIEYFDRQIKSDFDVIGNRTNDTKIGNKHADFIILQRLDGLDRCVVIELEESNDKIFNNDGTISKKVYDGIYQAVDYTIEQKFRKIQSRGIAIIGSLATRKLTREQKIRLHLLAESFPNVEILTYDQIIQKAEITLSFWKKYENKI